MITRRDFIKITTAGGTLASFGEYAQAKNAFKAVTSEELYISEEEKKIPIISDVDIVIAGGSSAAISAAVSAAGMGKKVFLITSLPYMGDDICGSYMYDLQQGEKPTTMLGRKIYLQSKTPTPLYVKTVLEDELIANDIAFLYSSFVTNVLIDSQQKPSGVVIANRSGRQAIRCKAIIDATHTAEIAKMCGSRFSPFEPGNKSFDFTVVGNTLKESSEIQKAEVLNYTVSVNDRKLPVTRYSFLLPVKENTYSAIQSIEQIIRTRTWDAEQGDSADLISYVPFCTIESEEKYNDSFSSVRKIPQTAFKPKGVDSLWVLGGASGVSRDVAKIIMRPVQSMLLGEIIGEWVANDIVNRLPVENVTVKQTTTSASNHGQVKELLHPLRQSMLVGMASSPKGALPILGSYDVVVMGGGTAGAPAGISAARSGAKTLVLEYLHGLGGLTTLGLIGRYWDGFRGGFSMSADEGVRAMAPLDHIRQHKDWKDAHNSDWKQEWFRRELQKAGGDLWFGVMGCGALLDNGKVCGIIVATPFGRGVILSKMIIDSTGSADIAIAAGAEYEYSNQTGAVQGAGLTYMKPWDYYNNSDWAFIDDTDVLDVSRVYVQAKKKHEGKYDIVKIPQTRERRRIVGEYTISVSDVLTHRHYYDTISYHKSSFDTHGMIIDPYFILSPPQERHAIYDADVPLRCLLPKGLNGIIVTGLGASAHRDAMPVIRMQSCLQNQGFAVGYLAAVCVKENKSVRQIDIKKIQSYLVKIGNLPERVLKDKDFKGFSNKEFSNAADTVVDKYKGLEILLTDRDRCLSVIERKMNDSLSKEVKETYASILCILGNGKYVSVLADKIRDTKEWDKGWHYTGMGQFGMCLSRLDALIMALGNTKDKSVLPVIIEKAKVLMPEDYFSHFRAVSMALGTIGDRVATNVLTDLLTMPGMRNHYINSYADARRKTVPGNEDVSVRNEALKELHLARALYQCGDKNKLGETILSNYLNGLQGHYSRYAENSLKNG